MSPRIAPQEWSENLRRKEAPERAQFLESHLDLVRYLALRLSTRLPASVEVDDLMHDGIVGLLDATERFDPERGVRFRTYAESRIRGAILDGLRSKDWRPRSVRRQARSLDAALGQLAAQHGRAATEDEIACVLGLQVEAYRDLLTEISRGTLVSMDELELREGAVLSSDQRTEASLERQELIQALASEIERLPQRERRVLELYYFEELTMKEIGAVLGVTESRVCQLHAQSAARLRAGLDARLHAPQAALARGGRT